MPLRRTEQLHEAARGLDARPLSEIAELLAEGQVAAARTVTACAAELAEGAALMAKTIEQGGRLHYAAAGSSGLMAMADACELAGTYGVDPDQIVIHMAGGIPRDAAMPGDTEDDAGEAARIAAGLTDADTMILVTASGSTPYVMALATVAKDTGARLIGIANNIGAPLFDHVDLAICLPTPPEVLAGSTRLGAGTAQKAALNTMSTLMGVALGHVHDGMMVNVRADNMKLRSRASGMIATIAGVDETLASDCLERAGGAVKPAILLAAGATDLNDATDRLARSGGHVRAALAAMTRT